MKAISKLLDQRPWIAHIDDERDIDNSIIVTLKDGWFFADDQTCGVMGFDTIAEVKEQTKKSNVVQK